MDSFLVFCVRFSSCVMSQLHMLRIPGSITTCPYNRQDWWHSPVTLLLGGIQGYGLVRGFSLITLLVSWIHTDVDFKSGLCCTAANVVSS